MSKIIKRGLAACLGLLLAVVSFAVHVRYPNEYCEIGHWSVLVNVAALGVGVAAIMSVAYAFTGRWGEQK